MRNGRLIGTIIIGIVWALGIGNEFAIELLNKKLVGPWSGFSGVCMGNAPCEAFFEHGPGDYLILIAGGVPVLVLCIWVWLHLTRNMTRNKTAA